MIKVMWISGFFYGASLLFSESVTGLASVLSPHLLHWKKRC